MTIANIIDELDAEIAQLEQVKKLLMGGSRLAPDKLAATKTRDPIGKGRRKRTLSPEARQRIAEAQRKRWAKQKKAAK
jgi:hypothetical protein